MLAARYPLHQWYRAAARGVVITWRDRTETSYAGRQLLFLDRPPLKIHGRLFRTTRTGNLEYEAPALKPES